MWNSNIALWNGKNLIEVGLVILVKYIDGASE